MVESSIQKGCRIESDVVKYTERPKVGAIWLEEFRG